MEREREREVEEEERERREKEERKKRERREKKKKNLFRVRSHFFTTTKSAKKKQTKIYINALLCPNLAVPC